MPAWNMCFKTRLYIGAAKLLFIELLGVVQGVLRRHDLAVGIFHCHAYDAEEAALIKGLGGELRGTATMGQAESDRKSVV